MKFECQKRINDWKAQQLQFVKKKEYERKQKQREFFKKIEHMNLKRISELEESKSSKPKQT